jgi:Kelch motif protein
MTRPFAHNVALMLSLFVLASCESTTPTEPATAEAPSASALPNPGASHPWLPNTWTKRAPLTDLTANHGGLFGVAAGVVNNSAGQPIVYALGGTDGAGGCGFNVQAYNLATNTWTAKKSEVVWFFSNGVGKIGSKLYFSGGYQYCSGSPVSSPQLTAYDVPGDRLIAKAPMPKATADGVSGVINGKLYVLPGNCSGEFWPDPHYCEHEPIRQLFRYDPVTDTWKTLARAPHYHANGAGGVIHGKFYVAGGTGSSTGATGGSGNAYLDVYDPWSNTWTTLAAMPARRPFAAGAIQNGKLWVVAGSSRSTYVYDPVTNRWATKAPLPTGGATQAAVPVNDTQSHILVVGGEANGEVAAPSELYTP